MATKASLYSGKENKHRVSKRATLQAEETDSCESTTKITPLKFDQFLPWLCKQWQMPYDVFITKICAVPSTRNSYKKNFTPSSGEVQHNVSEQTLQESTQELPQLSSTTIFVFAYYDTIGNLTAISIPRCNTFIPQKFIQAINVCIPFHSCLNILTITDGGLNYATVNEIRKLLPLSNITEIILDGNNVPEANYYILLNKATQLNHLSLRKCGINDYACKEIFTTLTLGQPASKSLRILNLAINDITDTGASFIAETIRNNRCLRHLNLCGNKITDAGADAILNYLLEFPLTADEILEFRTEKIKYSKKFNEVYTQCLNSALESDSQKLPNYEQDKMVSSNRSKNDKRSKSKSKQDDKQAAEQYSHQNMATDTYKTTAKARATEILGEFRHVFDIHNTKLRKGYTHAIGNMALCSLNLAYNNLSYMFVKKLCEVLKYQSQFLRSEENTGLLRVVIEGNNIPSFIEEYQTLIKLLKIAETEMIAIEQSCGRSIDQQLKSRSKQKASSKSQKITMVSRESRLFRELQV